MASSRKLTPGRARQALKKLLPELVKAAAQKEIDVTASQVASIASQKAPFRTGALANSITWKSRPRSISAVSGIDDPIVSDYWKYVEYGTVFQGQKPFFRPAALQMESDHRQRLVRGLRRAANDMAKKA